jgi:Family of unknown function (DUF6878)
MIARPQGVQRLRRRFRAGRRHNHKEHEMSRFTDWQKHRQDRLFEQRQALAALRERLVEQEITSIEAHYDGAGDSGMVESVTFLAGEQTIEVTDQDSLVVEGFVEALVQSHEPGWEDNEGSFGIVRIDLATRAVTLEHFSRYTTYEERSYKEAI